MGDMKVKFSDHTVSERHLMQTAWNTSLIPQYQRAEFWRSAVCDAFLAMTPKIARRRHIVVHGHSGGHVEHTFLILNLALQRLPTWRVSRAVNQITSHPPKPCAGPRNKFRALVYGGALWTLVQFHTNST
jgi:hypothetical protein